MTCEWRCKYIVFRNKKTLSHLKWAPPRTFNPHENVCAGHTIQEYDENEEDMCEPFARPFADFVVDVERRFFALVQAGFGPIPCTAKLLEKVSALWRICRRRKWIYEWRCWRPLWCTAAKVWRMTVCCAQEWRGRIEVTVWCLMRLSRRRNFNFYSWPRRTRGRTWPRWWRSRLRLCWHFLDFTFTIQFLPQLAWHISNTEMGWNRFGRLSIGRREFVDVRRHMHGELARSKFREHQNSQSNQKWINKPNLSARETMTTLCNDVRP